MGPIVSMQDVSLRYHSISGETPAVSHLNLTVDSGEFISIVGPSGCGKSTILSMLAGQLPPSEGTVEVNGTIGYMLQKDHLLHWRNILSNTLLGLEIQKKLTSENIQFVHSLLNQYGLKDFKEHFPWQLSGGMRQRAALIRTLAIHPDILLLDEPFSALDYLTRVEMQEWLLHQWEHYHRTILFITHDVEEAVFLSRKIFVIQDRPICTLEVVDVPLPEERHRSDLKRPEIVELKERLIDKLRGGEKA